MVLLARIELAASPLPRECSTTELQQHYVPVSGGGEYRPNRALARPFLSFPAFPRVGACVAIRGAHRRAVRSAAGAPVRLWAAD